MSKVVNPFGSDSVSDMELGVQPSFSSVCPESAIVKVNPENSFCKENEVRRRAPASPPCSSVEKEYGNKCMPSNGFENQTVHELEHYAVNKADKTTHTVKNCLKIAEDIREEATRTLITLDQQGEQITNTHFIATEIDQNLSQGEKLLASLGGIFSRAWKPKISHAIKGPTLFRANRIEKNYNNQEERENLGLLSSFGSRAQRKHPSKYDEPTSALEKIELEKAKQDDTLSDLSNLLGQLKDMAVDMGSEIGRQNKSLSGMQDDVDELNIRMKGANQRGRQLLRK